MDQHKQELLRNLPKIDELMLLLEKRGIFGRVERNIVKELCRSHVDNLRSLILSAKANAGQLRLPILEDIAGQIIDRVDGLYRYRLRRVINATGVILHTNLGRAPLCREAVQRIVEIASGYSNLEYDLEKGERGLRYDHVAELLCILSGAQDALVVNNNAAAVLLVLNTLAEGKEAIVSRGELIEIGGEFRIPDVMEKSGANLREVGTTNRTRLRDYERAIGSDTALIMKVHTSNYLIVGFTEEADIPSIVSLGSRHGIPVFNDLGSGCFVELDRHGMKKEPTVQEVVAAGVDVVAFSGDKLLGGPQAGIIVGKKDALTRIKKNPLNRALRIDKLTLAALEATLMHYLKPDAAKENVRIMKSLTEPLADVRKRARRLFSMLKKLNAVGFAIALKSGNATTGGGALPTQEIPTALLGIRPDIMTASELDARFRRYAVPIIARIADDEALIDLRTVSDDELVVIRDGLKAIFNG